MPVIGGKADEILGKADISTLTKCAGADSWSSGMEAGCRRGYMCYGFAATTGAYLGVLGVAGFGRACPSPALSGPVFAKHGRGNTVKQPARKECR